MIIGIDYLLANSSNRGMVRKVYKIANILEIIRRYALINFDFKTDESFLRPTDEAIIYGDSTKLKLQTGRKQKFSIDDTIKDMFDYWRKHI
jgi:GDP-4-dehydro-6-deoxy-D-mannose reductase